MAEKPIGIPFEGLSLSVTATCSVTIDPFESSAHTFAETFDETSPLSISFALGSALTWRAANPKRLEAKVSPAVITTTSSCFPGETGNGLLKLLRCSLAQPVTFLSMLSI